MTSFMSIIFEHYKQLRKLVGKEVKINAVG